MTRAALAAIVALAAGLRLTALGSVPSDPFYDASVRSMAGSWHAFLVGAIEPGARVAIDKPPLDLWLQTASVSVLGFGRVALQLPAALAGIAAVVLLYDLVRRVVGPPAGLASALALAVLPVSVLTARSDTMDTVMMALLVLAAWLVVRARQAGRPWLLWAAGAVAGLAFEAKLFESLVALPALAVLALWAWPGRRRQVLGAGAVFLVVALGWLTTISLLPASQRPFALGGSNGNAWNAAFVYDGLARLGVRRFGGHGTTGRPEVGQPGPLRLLRSRPVDIGARLGVVALAAVLFGGLAAATWRRGRGRRGPPLAAALALATWLATGLLVFSAMARLHVRYLEGFTPAVAAALGVGVAVLARRAGGHPRVALAFAAATVAAAAYAVSLPSSYPHLQALVAVAAGATVVAAVATALRPRAWPALAVLALVALLAVPTDRSVALVRSHAEDAGQAGKIAAPVLRRLSAYLIGHQGGAHDEVAVESPYTAAAIVVHDDRPLLVMDNVDTQPLVPLARLQAAARRGDVRFALLGSGCRVRAHRDTPACADSRWVRAHGVDVSAAAGLTASAEHHARLYRIDGPRPAATVTSPRRSTPFQPSRVPSSAEITESITTR